MEDKSFLVQVFVLSLLVFTLLRGRCFVAGETGETGRRGHMTGRRRHGVRRGDEGRAVLDDGRRSKGRSSDCLTGVSYNVWTSYGRYTSSRGYCGYGSHSGGSGVPYGTGYGSSSTSSRFSDWD